MVLDKFVILITIEVINIKKRRNDCKSSLDNCENFDSAKYWHEFFINIPTTLSGHDTCLNILSIRNASFQRDHV